MTNATVLQYSFKMQTNSTDIFSDLKSKGAKLTSARKQIITQLLNADRPLSAAEMVSIFNNDFDRTTIYRQITFLKNQGIVKEIDFGEGKKRYEFFANDHHHHLICLKCKSVEDFDLKQDLALEEKRIKKEKKFKVMNHSLEFFGVCKRCQR
ncbi:MAG: hypothetical protein ACD_30C00056G0006 [uncultured bacterium]|nr:MAG: hypothetical protein ACD_30C00056G0006 [uncultured bacterium]